MMNRNACQQRDLHDPLGPLRELFSLPQGVIYLDGNSLGPLPKAASAVVHDVVHRQWGQDLIRSWNSNGWFAMPQVLGDKLAPLVGARPGELVVCDTTSINLYKVLSVALQLQKAKPSSPSPGPRKVLSERSNFPTDLYIAQSLCAQHGFALQLVEEHEIAAALAQGDVAVLMLTHVNYRTGAMHDMAKVTHQAHAAGALVVWDLAHSAGAVPVDLHAGDADFAVGCGYKYLNGGPGAPAFLWIHPRHQKKALGQDQAAQPLSGWWGHAAPFAFDPYYVGAAGSAQYLCGTQPIISMAALACGLDTVLAADGDGKGKEAMQRLREKSLALTDLFIQLVHERLEPWGFTVQTPMQHALRGSQVSLSRDQGAYAIVQALIARGVIGDFRAGEKDAHGKTTSADILRFGFAPLYLRYVDVWDAVEHLAQVMQTQEWEQARFAQRHAVT